MGRDPAYLAWLRELPCILCRIKGRKQKSPVEAAHLGKSTSVRGMSRKYPDREAAPLCHDCHVEHHRGTKTFWLKHPEYDRDKIIAGLNRIYDNIHGRKEDVRHHRKPGPIKV